MKKLLLILLCLPMIGFGQCTSGDCFNGYGVFTSEEGTYKGNWKDAKPHGIGMFVGLEYTYDGEYLNGKKNGQGKMTYTNGKIDEGKFISGEFVFVKKKIGCISGNCENDWGVHKWSDGSSYSGYWKYGVRHGEGTFINKWGGKYVGEWKNGKEHGQGTKTFSYGTVERGKWINGVYQKPKTTKTKTVKPKKTKRYSSLMSTKNQIGYITNFTAHPWGGLNYFYFLTDYIGLYCDWRPSLNSMHPANFSGYYDGDENITKYGETLWSSVTNLGVSFRINNSSYSAWMIYGGIGTSTQKTYMAEYDEYNILSGDWWYYEDGGSISNTNYNFGVLRQTDALFSWQIGYDTALPGINLGIGFTWD